MTVRRGRKAASTSVVVHLLDDPQAHPVPRVGFVVSKAVGSAVVRNRVKRRLRAQMTSRLGSLNDGARLVVRALPQAAGRPSDALAADLDSALARAGAR